MTLEIGAAAALSLAAMAIRKLLAAGAALLLLSACTREETGPVTVSAIGGAPALANPNLAALDAPSAFLAEAAAQGLVRFDPDGEIEPALAQSWIVSDDGLRYTFRLRRIDWPDGGRVTAQQVVARLRAAVAGPSRNPLKPILGLIAAIEPMTDEVLEFTLRAPRPNFLQLLAQPELAILRDDRGTGPYRAAAAPDGSLLLTLPPPDDEDAPPPPAPAIALRGERAPLAVARFAAGAAELVVGGTAGDLPIARAATLPGAALQFDPVAGLFGLVFQRAEGPLAEPAARRALAMAVDRDAIVAALAIPGLLPRASLLPPGLEEVPAPAAPDWAAVPFVLRRQQAAAALRTLAAPAGDQPIRLRVAMPDGPGYRLIFAYLARDWRAVGVTAERVAATDATADLRFVDTVAPAAMAAWYLRNFTCEANRVCSAEADAALAAARETPNMAERRQLLANADALIGGAAIFVPIAAPVRWALVAPRLTGFRRNMFARHAPAELIEEGS
jgi:oligopeptide transport system substrate-binding protein